MSYITTGKHVVDGCAASVQKSLLLAFLISYESDDPEIESIGKACFVHYFDVCLEWLFEKTPRVIEKLFEARKWNDQNRAWRHRRWYLCER